MQNVEAVKTVPKTGHERKSFTTPRVKKVESGRYKAHNHDPFKPIWHAVPIRRVKGFEPYSAESKHVRKSPAAQPPPLGDPYNGVILKKQGTSLPTSGRQEPSVPARENPPVHQNAASHASASKAETDRTVQHNSLAQASEQQLSDTVTNRTPLPREHQRPQLENTAKATMSLQKVHAASSQTDKKISAGPNGHPASNNDRAVSEFIFVEDW